MVLEKVQKYRIKHKKDDDIYPPCCETDDLLYLLMKAPSSIVLGENVEFSVKLLNPSDQEKEVQLAIGLQAVYYNGVLAAKLWTKKFVFTLSASSGTSLRPLPNTLHTQLLLWAGSSHTATPAGLQAWFLVPDVLVRSLALSFNTSLLSFTQERQNPQFWL